MSILQYDPENWLVSCTRSLGSYIESLFDSDIIDVELNFPDTLKLMPLEKTLIHIEQDDMEHPVLGFGTPGREVFTPAVGPDPLPAGTWLLEEGQPHLVNYDVGVWASRESGGSTSRMQVQQVLSNAFARPEGKKAMHDATGGLWVVSFTGGRNELDRLDDVPVWRGLDMTIIVRVGSRHIPAEAEVVPDDADQDQQLTITDNSGAQAPV